VWIPANDYTITPWKNSDAEALTRAKARCYDLPIIAGDHVRQTLRMIFTPIDLWSSRAGMSYVMTMPRIVDRDDVEFIGDDWGTAVFKVRRILNARA
jgi:hypothetical protein